MLYISASQTFHHQVPPHEIFVSLHTIAEGLNQDLTKSKSAKA